MSTQNLDTEVHLRIASSADFPELLALWTSVFEAPPEAFTCQFESVPAEHRFAFVAEASGQIVASVVLFGIPIRGDWMETLMIGGLANVATLPECRDQGLCARLLSMARTEMIAQAYAWGFLFTGSHSFYERHGWRTIHRSFLSVHVGSLALARHTSSVILEAEPDLSRLKSLSDASIKFPLSQVRTSLDWEVKVPYRIASKAVFMADDSFAIVRQNSEVPVLEEWGMPEASETKFEELLIAIAHWAKERNYATLTVSAPIIAEAREALETLFSHVQDVEEAEGMVLPITEEWPMSHLISFFSKPEARFFRIDNF